MHVANPTESTGRHGRLLYRTLPFMRPRSGMRQTLHVSEHGAGILRYPIMAAWRSKRKAQVDCWPDVA
jgi:hypothetical protein